MSKALYVSGIMMGLSISMFLTIGTNKFWHLFAAWVAALVIWAVCVMEAKS